MKEENINIDKEINDLIPKEDNEIKIINDDIIEDDEIIKEEEKEDEKDKDNEKEIKEEKEKSVDSGGRGQHPELRRHQSPPRGL